jgi:hypothetical protein
LVIIIILIIFFLYFRRIKKRNINLEDKLKPFSSSAGMEEDSLNSSMSEKSKDDDENTFI